MALHGTRIFVVEDEALVLLELQDLLVDLGCTVVGSAVRLDDALAKAKALQSDAAVLDVNLGGQRVDAVAAALNDRNIPFVFVSGYGRNALPRGFQDRPLVSKPYGKADIEAALETCLSR